MFKQIYKEYILSNDKANFRYTLMKKYPKEYEYLVSSDNWFVNEQLPVKLFIITHALTEYPKCKCNTPITTFNKNQNKFSEVCNTKSCEHRKQAYASRLKINSLRKYGVENISHASQIKEKISKNKKNLSVHKKQIIQLKREQTNLKKYGFKTPAENLDILEKIKKTNLDRFGEHFILSNTTKIRKAVKTKYGVDNVMLVDYIKDKAVSTNKNNHNGIGFSSENIIKKIKETNLEKYGFENAMHNSEIKEKMLQTTLNRFGVTSVLSLEEIRNKSKETWIQKMEFKINNFQTLKPLFDFNTQYVGIDTEYGWQCTACDTKFFSNLNDGIYPKCPTCYPYTKSKEELNIKKYLEEELGLLVLHNKKPFGKFEIDLLIPELKIAIEYNGLYWHADDKIEKNYHLNKTNLVEENGYQLIHIYEHLWLTKPEIIKSMLKAKAGKNIKINARQCDIKEITTTLKNNFLNLHHIQGEDKSSVKLGLFFKNELLQVMTFGKPRFTNNSCIDYEMIRLASKSNTTVVGGANKLFCYFKKKYVFKKIISYADRSHSMGNVYKKMGFKQNNISPPNFWVFGNSIKFPEHRLNWQKYKLNKKLITFDVNISAWDNMSKNGYKRYWDSGNLVFVYENK